MYLQRRHKASKRLTHEQMTLNKIAELRENNSIIIDCAELVGEEDRVEVRQKTVDEQRMRPCRLN